MFAKDIESNDAIQFDHIKCPNFRGEGGSHPRLGQCPKFDSFFGQFLATFQLQNNIIYFLLNFVKEYYNFIE